MSTSRSGARARRILLLAIVLAGFHLRTAGLLRGLNTGHIVHPDAPKQMRALSRYLRGDYVWRYGNLAYDGYPYGLNRLDEWILRPLLTADHHIRSYLYATDGRFSYPKTFDLYFWARWLRVAYGMAVVLLAWRIASWLWGVGSYWPLLTTLLISVAPLASTVTHEATGDIGVDLFTALIIASLCHFQRRPARLWLVLAGICCGFAFACKYQGALGALLIAGFLLLDAWVCAPFPWKRIAGDSCLVFAGAVLGAVVGAPALLLNTKTAWQDMLANFTFIEDYGVTPDFLEKSLVEKAWYGVTQNLPRVLSAFGVALVALSAVGAAVALSCAVRRDETGAADPTDHRRTALIASVAMFPFVAMFLSTALKPTVQFFHFSYLQLPLILAAVHACAWSPPMAAKSNSWRRVRVLSFVVMAVALVELGIHAEYEYFFWSRQGNQDVTGRYAAEVLKQPMLVTDREPRGTVLKYFFLEKDDNLAVFRNRPFSVANENAPFWQAVKILPVPTIPLGGDSLWVFLNGPVFPRNDRMFEVRGEARKDLVFYGKVPPVFIGLRSSRIPTQVTLEVGGSREVIALLPHSQRVVTATAMRWRTVASAAPDGSDIYIVSLSLHAGPGTAWVNVMTEDEELANWEAFGASQLEPIRARLGRLTESELELVRSRIDDTRFVGPVDGLVRTLPGKGTVLLGRAVALPAGRYRLTCEVEPGGTSDKVSVEWRDPEGLSRFVDTREEYLVTEDNKVVPYLFAKPFAPLEVNFLLTSASGRARLKQWTLEPDAPGLIEDLVRHHGDSSKVPAWAARGPKLPSFPKEEVLVQMGGVLRLKAYSFPDAPVVAEPFYYGFSFDLLDYEMPDFDDLAVFVHLTDRTGRVKQALGYRLRQANFDPGLWNPIEYRLPQTMKPGEYELRVGVWNPRKGKRQPVVTSSGLHRIEKNAVVLKTVRVVESGGN